MSINNFFRNLTIQDYIPLGYLYLVLIGIINIVIYYTSFNINIFDYIAITDILLAPINMLFLDYMKTAIIIVVIAIISYLAKFLFLGFNLLIAKIGLQWNKSVKPIVYQPVIMFLILFSYVFLVMSISMADYVKTKVNNKTYKHNTTLTFADNTQKDVYVFATTSIYIFYVEKGEEKVTIIPISGNVKSIKDINNL